MAQDAAGAFDRRADVELGDGEAGLAEGPGEDVTARTDRCRPKSSGTRRRY
jgi:hypothetical protein